MLGDGYCCIWWSVVGVCFRSSFKNRHLPLQSFRIGTHLSSSISHQKSQIYVLAMSLVFDPELSAHLHNRILERAWIGAGRDADSIPSKSWWEESSPIPFDLASRLNPKLIRFLRSAKAIIFNPDSGFDLFYYLLGLHGKEGLFASTSILRWWGDRYVWLYPSTRIQTDEEVGIL